MKRGDNLPGPEKLAGFLVAAALTPNAVLAQSLGGSQFGNFFSRGFRGLFNMLGNRAVQGGVTLFLYLVIIYAITLAGLKRVKVFQGENGSLSRQGKVFAFAFSALATIGLFFGTRNSFYTVVERVLEVAGVFSMVLLGIIFFLLTYFGFKQDDERLPCAALMAAGLAFILPSYLMEWQGWFSFGWLLLVIGLIWCIIRLFRGSGSSGDSGSGGGNSGNSGGNNNGNNNDGGNNDGGVSGGDNNDKNKGKIRVIVRDADTHEPLRGVAIGIDRAGGAINPLTYWQHRNYAPRAPEWWRSNPWTRGWNFVTIRFEGYTNDEGIFEFSAKKGNRDVYAGLPDYEWQRLRARIVPGETRDVYIDMRRNAGTAVDITVGPNRNVPLGTRQWIRVNTSEPNQQFTIDYQGEGTPIPRGPYTTDGAGQSQTFHVVSGTDGTATITATARTSGRSATCTIVFGSGGTGGGGDPLDDVQVMFRYTAGGTPIATLIPGVPAEVVITRTGGGRFSNNPANQFRFLNGTTPIVTIDGRTLIRERRLNGARTEYTIPFNTPPQPTIPPTATDYDELFY